MKILKFGGTSVGSAQRMNEVANIIQDGERKVVVLSAMSGTTNDLVEISELLYNKKTDSAIEKIKALEDKYYKVVDDLYKQEKYKNEGKQLISKHFEYLLFFTQDSFTLNEEKAVLAQGELISTALFTFFLHEKGINAALLPALNFMRIDKSNEPDLFYISENIKREFTQYTDVDIFITQGYICRDAYGEIDNLKRGGSDYTASLIGAALNVDEIQIWTDIDGFHNNDPRYVENTKSIKHLSFDEAAELAYFGAKILHPTSVLPAQQKNVPVRLKNTMNPEAYGTLITSKTQGDGIKAIAGKDGITVIRIKSDRMLMAYGFLRKVFEVFETCKTPIDMISTSEVAVSVTIDKPTRLDEIKERLTKYGSVEIDRNQSIICVVGNLDSNTKGRAGKIFSALGDIPVSMISYGASGHNISMLVDEKDKIEALKNLSNKLF